MKPFIIYLVVNTVNGKKYVGQTKQKLKRRWAHHVSHAPNDPYPFHRALAKYGADAFTVAEIDRAENLDEANDKERVWIKTLETFDPEVGYNSTMGGDGVPLTEAGLQKLRKAMTGLPRPESARKKLSEAYKGPGNPMFGSKQSEERKKWRSDLWKTRWESPEHREKVTAAQKAAWVKRKARALDNPLSI